MTRPAMPSKLSSKLHTTHDLAFPLLQSSCRGLQGCLWGPPLSASLRKPVNIAGLMSDQCWRYLREAGGERRPQSNSFSMS
eukprot:1157270-Pelagomonas_calceolata.AAC.6